jgi:hypothetical protein
MIKYIRTQIVSAKPMSLGEFVKHSGFNPYASNQKLCNNAKEGYIVEYEDGHISWSQKNDFEKEYKVANTALDRMHIEYNELMEKYNKLAVFLGREDAISIAGQKQIDLMQIQKKQMFSYACTLNERIMLMEKSI